VEDVLAVLCVRPPPAARPPADEELPALEVSEEEAEVEEAPFRLKTQARRVTAAKHVIPHFYVTMGADVTRLLERRAELKAKMGATVTHLVMLACLRALRQHPQINRTWDRGRIIRWKHVNLGLAVETEQGLTVAVLPQAEDLPLPEIVARTVALAERARQGRLAPDDRRHPTFVISNLGMYGVEAFEAILNPPASVTLAVASALAAPVVRGGGIYVGTVMRLTASCDHRIIDGAAAAKFLRDLKALLENPETLLEGPVA
jgi:pyruvate dehydrogenase E2 component (dihydrolipoamide acetyltransferase)